MAVAYRDFSGQACNDEMITSSVSKFSSILIFDKTSNFKNFAIYSPSKYTKFFH